MLCTYRYTKRVGRSTLRREASVMLEVEFSDQIENAFRIWRDDHIRHWNYRHCGDCPTEITLTGYVPSNDKPNF